MKTYKLLLGLSLVASAGITATYAQDKEEAPVQVEQSGIASIESGTYRGLHYEVGVKAGKWFVDMDKNGKNDAGELAELVLKEGTVKEFEYRPNESQLVFDLPNGDRSIVSIEKKTNKMSIVSYKGMSTARYKVFINDKDFDGVISKDALNDNMYLVPLKGEQVMYDGKYRKNLKLGPHSPKGVWAALIGHSWIQAKEKYSPKPATVGVFEGLDYVVEVKNGNWVTDMNNNKKNDAEELVQLISKHGKSEKEGRFLIKELDVLLSNGAACRVSTTKADFGESISLSLIYVNKGKNFGMVDDEYNGLTEKGFGAVFQYHGEKVDEDGLKARWGAIIGDALKQLNNEYEVKKEK